MPVGQVSWNRPGAENVDSWKLPTRPLLPEADVDLGMPNLTGGAERAVYGAARDMSSPDAMAAEAFMALLGGPAAKILGSLGKRVTGAFRRWRQPSESIGEQIRRDTQQDRWMMDEEDRLAGADRSGPEMPSMTESRPNTDESSQNTPAWWPTRAARDQSRSSTGDAPDPWGSIEEKGTTQWMRDRGMDINTGERQAMDDRIMGMIGDGGSNAPRPDDIVGVMEDFQRAIRLEKYDGWIKYNQALRNFKREFPDLPSAEENLLEHQLRQAERARHPTYGDRLRNPGFIRPDQVGSMRPPNWAPDQQDDIGTLALIGGGAMYADSHLRDQTPRRRPPPETDQDAMDALIEGLTRIRPDWR